MNLNGFFFFFFVLLIELPPQPLEPVPLLFKCHKENSVGLCSFSMLYPIVNFNNVFVIYKIIIAKKKKNNKYIIYYTLYSIKIKLMILI